MKYLVGVDAGTTSFKAILCDEHGKMIMAARREYSLLVTKNKVEFVPEEYWNIFCDVVNSLLEESGVNPDDVASLAISSQGETLICLDAEGNSIGNAIVWLDNRSVDECRVICEAFSPQELFEHTGQYEVEPTWTATKLIWMRKNEPQRMSKAKKFLLLEDYLIYRLTGSFVCERTLPASTLLYDIAAGDWWQDMLRLTGISKDMLPDLADSAVPVGTVLPSASAQSGLSPKTLVVTGALDQIAAMVGAGNMKPGMVTETTGSCLVVDTVVDRIPVYTKTARITCQPFCIQGSYILMMFSNTAGMALKWFRSCFCDGQLISYEKLCEEAADIPPGAEGLYMLPHLAGSQFPRYNPSSSGLFCGMTLMHRRGHFVRALLESVAYVQRSMLEVLEQSGYNTAEVTTLGGGASSDIWNTIKANVSNRRISTIEAEEPAAFGAAALAGVGCGIFRSLEEACGIMVKPGSQYLPDDDTARVYNRLYKRYMRLDDLQNDVLEIIKV